MFVAADQWPTVHRGLSRDVPQPAELALETPEVLENYVRRVKQGFATLQAGLEATKPDAVLIIGDDQNELFSNALFPSFAIFVGESAEGTFSISWIGEQPKDNWIKLPCNSAVARLALEGLIERGFDFGFAEKLVPLARPELGIGHAFTRIGRVIRLVETGIPAVPIFINAYHPPLPSAARCYALGQALRDIFAKRPERVAIYGSGGLSHDPRGPRAGWVDEPLDRGSSTGSRGAKLRSFGRCSRRIPRPCAVVPEKSAIGSRSPVLTMGSREPWWIIFRRAMR
jgi:hypothetical protein